MHRGESAEQPHREQLASFDTLASVDMFRFDLQRYGHILPETRQRIYDEELSSMSEGVDRAAYTPFRLQRQDGHLTYFNKGHWVPYTSMLKDGVEAAENDARNDYRKQFLVDWAERDRAIGFKMNALRPSQQLVWHNSYPYDAERRFGADFLQKRCGLFPDRAMGFIYRASCAADGSVLLESHTVDRSDADAFAAVERLSEYDPDADMETLVRTYDGNLVKKYGGRFFAGRRNAERGENAWTEITRHHDLITYFMDGLEALAAQNIPRDELRTRAEQHVYGVWKAFKNRLNATQQPTNIPPQDGYVPAYHYDLLAREVHSAFLQATALGEIKAGCGGSIGGRSVNDTDPSGTFSSIFGEKLGGGKAEGPESYKFDKRMYCVVCQAPPTEQEQKTGAKKMCGPCGICKHCDTKIQAKAKGAYALAA